MSSGRSGNGGSKNRENLRNLRQIPKRNYQHARKADENIASEDNIIRTSDMIEMMFSGDTRQENKAFGEDVVIDYAKMNAMLEAALQEVN